MQKVAEFTGKKVEDAVREGLKTLGITLDDADIKIVSNGGLFKKAKVEIRYEDNSVQTPEAEKKENAKIEKTSVNDSKTKNEFKKNDAKKAEQPPENEPHWGSAPVKREPTTKSDFGKKANSAKLEKETSEVKQKEDAVTEKKEQPEKKAQQPKERNKKEREYAPPTEEQVAVSKEYAEKLIKLMGIEGTVEIEINDGMRINVNTEDSRIIGHRGEVLDSVQQLISSLINTSHGNYVHVVVDGLGYRGRRKETLESMARRMADKAVRTHRKVTLDAMSSADRRIIHAALGDREDVFTRSEGHEPARCVAILPKRR